MKVEIKEGSLVVTPITKDEERLIFALAAAYQAFESVLYPITAQAVRCTEGDKTQLAPSLLHQEKEAKS